MVGEGQSGHHAAMKARLLASLLGLAAGVTLVGPVGLGGCASSSPPPPVAASAAPLPPERIPTLSVQTRYEADGLVIALRLDGEPVRGELRLLDAVPFEPLTSPGEPIGAEDAARGLAVMVTEGEVRFSPDQVSVWRAKQEIELVVAGRRYPYAQSPGAWAFGCEASVVELATMEACTQLLPVARMTPPHCDASGQSAWEQIRARLAAAQEGCWRAPDDTTLAEIDRIADPTLHAEACVRVLQGTDRVSEAVGIGLVTVCEAQLSAAQRERWLLPERRATLPAAFEVARLGKADQQLAFYLRYRVTRDPRVEEIRQLAAKTYGPKNPARFLAAARSIEGLSDGSHRIRLCSFDEQQVRVAYSYLASFLGDNQPADPAALPLRVARAGEEEIDHAGGSVGSEDDGAGIEPGRRGCGLRSPVLRYRIMKPRPDPLRVKTERVARALTGAHQIDWRSECTATERWFLIPPKEDQE
jgi:hypothetical protein